jgi:hypothetical protein
MAKERSEGATWHYQLMRHKTPHLGDDEGIYYAIHEYHEMKEGQAWSMDPVEVIGESVNDVIWSLKAMLHDIQRHGVKDYE